MLITNPENIKDGDIVTPVVTNDYLYKLHYRNPQWYPKIGVKGVVIGICSSDAFVNWPRLGSFYIGTKYLQKVKVEDA